MLLERDILGVPEEEIGATITKEKERDTLSRKWRDTVHTRVKQKRRVNAKFSFVCFLPLLPQLAQFINASCFYSACPL